MLENICELTKYYSNYEKIYTLHNKISLLIEINNLEEKVIANINSDEITEYILKNFYKKSLFIKTRFSYLLSKINISHKYSEEVSLLILFEIENIKEDTLLPAYIPYFITLIGNLNLVSFKNFLLEAMELNPYKIYRKHILISLCKVSSAEEILVFMLDTLKRYPSLKETIFLCIGYLACGNNKPLAKRSLFKPYLKYVKRLIIKDTLEERELTNLYFSLIKIYSFQCGIDGKITNDILEALFLHKKELLLYQLTLKSINNEAFSLEEKLQTDYIFTNKKNSF